MVDLEPSEVERRSDFEVDYGKDYSQELPVDFNLNHLTLSETALKFFSEDAQLSNLLPLIDQICSTNYIDERGRDLYRSMIMSQIIELQMWTDEDDDRGFIRLNTAKQYLFTLLDGCVDGYRGRMATELKRSYRMETSESTKKRRWSIL